MPVLQGTAGVQIEYKQPTNPAHQPLYERLTRRTVLEQYKEFMSPLQLKRVLRVSLPARHDYKAQSAMPATASGRRDL